MTPEELDMVKKLEPVWDSLNNWEQSFVRRIKRHCVTRDLSEKQANCLRKTAKRVGVIE